MYRLARGFLCGETLLAGLLAEVLRILQCPVAFDIFVLQVHNSFENTSSRNGYFDFLAALRVQLPADERRLDNLPPAMPKSMFGPLAPHPLHEQDD